MDRSNPRINPRRAAAWCADQAGVVHMWTSGNRGWGPERSISAVVRALLPGGSHMGDCSMTRFVGLDVSQKLASICVVDDAGRRLWRGQCHTDPEQIERTVRGHAGDDASIGIETGPMTPWLVHESGRRDESRSPCLTSCSASARRRMRPGSLRLWAGKDPRFCNCSTHTYCHK